MNNDIFIDERKKMILNIFKVSVFKILKKSCVVLFNLLVYLLINIFELFSNWDLWGIVFYMIYFLIEIIFVEWLKVVMLYCISNLIIIIY